MQLIKYLLILCLGASVFTGKPLMAAAKKQDVAAAPHNRDSNLTKESLDQNKIHALYNNGDFEPVISVLEDFMKRNKTYSHSDSLFIAKHLAVVFSANPATREKGKYYMFRLLELMPSAKIVDMFVSEEIDHIFEKVKEEFLVKQHAFGVDTSRVDLPERPGKGSSFTEESRQHNADPKKGIAIESKSHAWIPWTVGVAAVSGIGVGGYFMFLNNHDKGSTGANPQPMDVQVITPKN